MATLFMRIDGNTDIPGTATIGDITGTTTKGWFAIESVSWGAMRGVSVDIGNANNADSGMVAMGEVSISKSYDGATPFIQTFMYEPTKTGKLVQAVVTRPIAEGGGVEAVMIFTMASARVSNYSLSCGEGGLPSESFSLTYNSIDQSFKYVDADGALQDGETVKFDATTNKLDSKAPLK